MILPSPQLQQIGLSVREGRTRQGLTQRALANRAGLHQAQVARAEGGADLRLSTLLELAHAAGLDVILAPQALTPAILALIEGDRGPTSERALYAVAEDDE